MTVRERHNVRTGGREDGPVMLFAHGFGCDQKMWRFITPAFESAYRLVLFDYIGHGGAKASAYKRERYNSLDGYAQDILEICAELDLRDVTLVGHSVSAMIGILAAIREPRRFRRLVLVAPSPAYINDGEYRGGFSREDIAGLLDTLDLNFPAWATTMAPAIIGNPDRPDLAKELEDSFCRTDPAIAQQFAHVTFLSDHRADLAKTPVPSLIMQVTRDAIAPITVGRYMHEHTPQSELALVETTGHCPHLSAPRLTVEAIQHYLAP